MKHGKYEAVREEVAGWNDFSENPEAQQSPDQTQKPDDRQPVKNLLLYLHDVVYLLAAISVIFLLLFKVAVVSGDSMYNTLVDGDYLLLLGNTFYAQPKQGDIIVASKSTYDNGAPIVKRVIATEGQVVDIDFDAAIVYVDGVALDEPYVYSATDTFEGVVFPVTVEKGCVFVMGDNRHISRDSRSVEIGQIDTREIVGKVVFLIFPGTDGGNLSREFSRIGVLS